MVGFIIWCIVAALFIINGICCLFAKTITGFWSNIKVTEIEDIKGYNKDMCKLWITFGVVLGLLGLPLLDEQNVALIMLSVFGVIIEIIILMIVYIFVIEKKYCK